MVGQPERKTHLENSGRAWGDIIRDITYLLTPWSRDLLEKLISFQRVKKNCPHFMEPEGSLP